MRGRHAGAAVERGLEGTSGRRLPPEVAEDIPLDLLGLITALPDTAQIPWDGPLVRVVEHPAHSPGHAALLIEEFGVLAAGDMLSDVFIPMLGDFTDSADPIEEYLVGLRVLEGIADDVGGSSSRATARSVEEVGPAHGSKSTARMCTRCVTAGNPTTRVSAPRPSLAGNG